MSGTLYIVATPIGNLQDITIRAMDVLSEVDIILAEDTRVTRKLLDFIVSQRSQKRINGQLISYNAKAVPRLISYHQHSSEEKKLEILKMLIDGKSLALVTDAGTPGVSDPGNELVDFILMNSNDIKIIPIPGASAITTALSVSGFDVNKFVFLGFLPKKKRTKLFDWLKSGNMSFAFYESPQRILRTLTVLGETFGFEKKVFIARELTKIYETLYRGTVSEVSEMLKKEQVRGELVVILS